MAAPKTFKAFERDNGMFVTGKTVIDHAIRMRNNLTVTEYVFLATVMEIREGRQKNEPITYGRFWIACGINPSQVLSKGRKLIAKKLLFKDEAGLIQVSEDFKRQFRMNGNFEEFWKIAPEGSKQAAMRMYGRAIRIKKHEELSERYKDYVKFCEQSGRYRKDTSTWLNPANGYIDSEWVKTEKKEEDKNRQTNTLIGDFMGGK